MSTKRTPTTEHDRYTIKLLISAGFKPSAIVRVMHQAGVRISAASVYRAARAAR